MATCHRHVRAQAEPGAEGALPTAPTELRELGNQAVALKQWTRAVHLFTLGIDAASRGMPRDADGHAESPAALSEANDQSDGQLLKLLCNRSMCHLRASPPDVDAAIADGQAAVHAAAWPRTSAARRSFPVATARSAGTGCWTTLDRPGW